MSCVDTILFLIEKNNITKNKLLVDLKLGKNSFVNWIERGTSPSGETLAKIADYFNVSVDYLLGRADALTPDFSDMDVLAEVLSRLSNEQLLDVINKATARRQEK